MKKYLNQILDALTSKTAERICLALVMGAYTGAAFSADLDFLTTPLCGFANVFKGPLALAVATIAFFGAGAAALWGEEIAGISKKMVNIIMAVTIMMGGSMIVSWIANKVGVTASCT